MVCGKVCCHHKALHAVELGVCVVGRVREDGGLGRDKSLLVSRDCHCHFLVDGEIVVEPTGLSLHVVDQGFVNAVMNDAEETQVFADLAPNAGDVLYRTGFASHQGAEVNHRKRAMVLV